MKPYIVFLLVSALFFLCTLYIVRSGTCKEGFQAEGNALVNLVGNIKRINTYLVDPAMWTDRIEMLTMSPVDLARREIRKRLKS